MICQQYILFAAVTICLLLANYDFTNAAISASSIIEQLEDRALRQYMSKFDYGSIEEVPEKVVGGADAEKGEAPFQTQIYRKRWWGTQFLCGGSLITPRTILTAAHCYSSTINYRIRYGSNNRTLSSYKELEVEEVKIHPNFSMQTVQNDLALFVLKSPITPSSNVASIQLQTEPIPVNQTMILFGFGLMNGMGNSPALNLKKAQLQTLNDTDCSKFISELGLEKSEGMICAAAQDKSACNGDSGGPLVVASSGLQAGIVSFGTRFCPPGATNVFTKVSHYIDWIRANLVE